MSISAMKCALQSLESVEKVNGWNKDSIVGRHCAQSAHFLRQAIAEAENVHAIDMSEKHVQISDKNRHEWVGLTDEEIYDYADEFLYQHGSNYGIKSFGKAIEAKLREKNLGRL